LSFAGFGLALIVLCGCLGLFSSALAADDGVVLDHYIIKLRPNQNAAAVAHEMTLTHGFGVGHIYRHALHGFSAFVPQGRLNALRSDPRVVSIVADRYVSIDKPPCATPPCGGSGGRGYSTGASHPHWNSPHQW
jgi:Peptidase inhibitor I9